MVVQRFLLFVLRSRVARCLETLILRESLVMRRVKHLVVYLRYRAPSDLCRVPATWSPLASRFMCVVLQVESYKGTMRW